MLRYTPKVVLRQTPNRLLHRYFEAKSLLRDIPWTGLKETKIEPIHQAVLQLSAADRREIGRDFRAIHELASRPGAVLLVRTARQHGVDLTGPAFRDCNGHARALLAFLDHRHRGGEENLKVVLALLQRVLDRVDDALAGEGRSRHRVNIGLLLLDDGLRNAR